MKHHSESAWGQFRRFADVQALCVCVSCLFSRPRRLFHPDDGRTRLDLENTSAELEVHGDPDFRRTNIIIAIFDLTKTLLGWSSNKL